MYNIKSLYFFNEIFNEQYTKVFIFCLCGLGLGLLISILSYALAVQSPDAEKVSAYECGFEPFEDARNKFDIRFYVVAILFLIFDIEVLYLFPWVLSLNVIGTEGYWVMMGFLILLSVGFLYEVAKGALDWQ